MVRWLLFVLSLLFVTSAQATHRTVTTLADSGAGSLRNTIAASAAGDSIDFSVTGTITLTSGQLTISRDLHIFGPAGAISVSGNNNSRVFEITGGTVRISAMTIRDGRVAGMDFPDGNSGAGIFNRGTLILSDCIVATNNAVSTGGNAGSGAGIFNRGNLTMQRCLIFNNSASATSQYLGGQGAGIYHYDGTLNITDSSILGNSTNTIGNGGGLLTGGGIATIKNSTFSGNTCGTAGGAIFSNNSLTLIQCTFSGNTAPSAGAIFNGDALKMVSCTVSANSIGSGSGGIYNIDSLQMQNSIVADNGGSSFPDVYGTITSLGHNLIGKVDGSNGWIASDLTGTSAAPLDAQLQPLAENGGPTKTMWIPPGSPAHDAGDDVLVASSPTDQRGAGYPRRLGSHVDIGAIEGDGPQTGSVFTVTNTSDYNDGLCGTQDCTLREAVTAANAIAGTQTIKFAAGLSGFITLTGGELLLTQSVTIQGPGAAVLAIDGNNASRIWRIDAVGATIAMAGLSMQRGSVQATTSGSGGAIFNNANLSLLYCSVSQSIVRGGQGAFMGTGWDATGGGIYNSGALNLTSCTLNGNQVIGGSGGAGAIDPPSPGGDGGNGSGGAIYNSGTLNLNNCTLNSNYATGGSGGFGSSQGFDGDGLGGAVYNNFGVMTVNSCTISGNVTNSEGFSLGLYRGGGFYQVGNGGSIANTLIAGNTSSSRSPDVYGVFNSNGFNFIGKVDGSNGFTHGVKADQVGTVAAPLDPKLGPLQDNGGPTLTQALLLGSPAQDKGNTGLSTDQRGQVRPYNDPLIANAPGGDGSDIGAFERQRPSLSINDIKFFEGSSRARSAIFTVKLLDAGSNPVSVKYATANGSALSPADYIAVPPTTLTFNPGETQKTFTVSIQGDLIDEIDEFFVANLSAPVNSVIADTQGRATIMDDDEAPILGINDLTLSEGDTGSLNTSFKVTLNRASGKSVTLKYATANGTALAPADYTAVPLTALTFAPGETSKTVTVATKGDLLDETNETCFLNLSSVTNATVADTSGQATIIDNDETPILTINDVSVTESNSGTVNATFTVSLNAPSGQVVSVQYATAPGTATASTDYTSLLTTSLAFAPGQTARTVTVPVKGDLLDEINETFLVNLSNPVNAILADSQGVGTIVDNDATPTLIINDRTITEGNSGSTALAFTITLSAPSGRPVTVQYATVNGTALAPSDYTALPLTSVTFNPGERTKAVTALVNGDLLDEPNETFSVNLSSPTNATIADNRGIGTINDNDAPTLRTPSRVWEEESVMLWNARGNASSGEIELTFDGAAPLEYWVEVNGRLVEVESQDVHGSHTILYLPDGALKAGDEVIVDWESGAVTLTAK